MSEFDSLRFKTTGELLKFRDLEVGAYFVWSGVGTAVSVKIDTAAYVDLEKGSRSGTPRAVVGTSLEAGCAPVRIITDE